MKKIKIFTLIASIGLCAAAFFGCNKDMFDTNYTFNKAIVSIGNITTPIVLDIKQWCDYDGEQIQLILSDDSVILVSSFNTILVKGEDSLIFDKTNNNYLDYVNSQRKKAEK